MRVQTITANNNYRANSMIKKNQMINKDNKSQNINFKAVKSRKLASTFSEILAFGVGFLSVASICFAPFVLGITKDFAERVKYKKPISVNFPMDEKGKLDDYSRKNLNDAVDFAMFVEDNYSIEEKNLIEGLLNVTAPESKDGNIITDEEKEVIVRNLPIK